MAELEQIDLGTLEDRFRVMKILGKGGFGEVYLARRVQGDTSPVALKVCEMPIVDRDKAVARLIREVKNSRALEHHHAIRVYECGNLSDGRFYYAMELCNGPAVRDVLAEVGPLDQPRAIRIICQALDALAAANKLGMVHRDMKLENMHIVPGPDGTEHVKVLDFGLAKIAGGEGQDLTAQGQIIGTVSYMSPEHLRGKTLDGRSDLYAVGVMTYELLVGQRPFIGANPKEIMGHHLKSPVPSIRKVLGWTQVSRALDAAITKSLAKNADERFQTAEEMSKALLDAVPKAKTLKATFPEKYRKDLAPSSSATDAATGDVAAAGGATPADRSNMATAALGAEGEPVAAPPAFKPAQTPAKSPPQAERTVHIGAPPGASSAPPAPRPPGFPPIPIPPKPTGGPQVERTVAFMQPDAAPAPAPPPSGAPSLPPPGVRNTGTGLARPMFPPPGMKAPPGHEATVALGAASSAPAAAPSAAPPPVGAPALPPPGVRQTGTGLARPMFPPPGMKTPAPAGGGESTVALMAVGASPAPPSTPATGTPALPPPGVRATLTGIGRPQFPPPGAKPATVGAMAAAPPATPATGSPALPPPGVRQTGTGLARPMFPPPGAPVAKSPFAPLASPPPATPAGGGMQATMALTVDQVTGELAPVMATSAARPAASPPTGFVAAPVASPFAGKVSPSEAVTGEIVDVEARFEIRSTLHEGKIAQVIEAWDRETSRRVILRLVDNWATVDADMRGHYEKGVEALALVRHDLVAKLLLAGETTKGQHVTVLERFPGEQLTKRRRRGPLTPAEAVGVACQMLEAIEAAHAVSVLHRQLGTDQVLVHDTPGGPAIKLIGWDLAVAASFGTEATAWSPGNGLTRFMPPEQKTARPLHPSCDVYAVAAVLMEILTGNRFFPTGIGDRVPEGLKESIGPAILRALADDPAERFQSARAMRRVLTPVAGVHAVADLDAVGG